MRTSRKAPAQLLLGTDGPDLLTALEEDTLVLGLEGNDTITSGFQRTVIDAGDGDDLITLYSRGDSLRTEPAMAVAALSGGDGADRIEATLEAQSQSDATVLVNARGGSGDDDIWILGQASSYGGTRSVVSLTATGGEGTNRITLNAYAGDYRRNFGVGGEFVLTNSVVGGDDADVLSASMVFDQTAERSWSRSFVDGRGGDDVLSSSLTAINGRGVIGLSEVRAGSGADEVWARLGVTGNELGGLTRMIVDGGSGDDRLDVGQVGHNGALRVTLHEKFVTRIRADAGDDRVESFASHVAAVSARSLQIIDAGEGNDAVTARLDLTTSRTDAIDYGSVHGAFVLDGGTGNDRLSAVADLSAIDPYGGSTSGPVRLFADLRGGAGNDELTVDFGIDAMLTGHRFASTLDGGAGQDLMTVTTRGGDRGLHVLSGGDGNDSLSVAVRDADSAIRLSGGAGNDSLSTSIIARGRAQEFGLITAQGGRGDDVIDNVALIGPGSGAKSAYRFEGGEGNDRVQSRTEFFGGAAGGFSHAESLSGGTGDDVLAASVGPYVERTSWPDLGIARFALALAGGDGADTLLAVTAHGWSEDSESRIVMDGGAGDDRLEAVYTGQGTNILRLTGGTGDDFLTLYNGMTVVSDVWTRLPTPGGGSVLGGSGDDTLGGWGGEILATGGAGVDTFLFDPAAQGEMRITDFDGAAERIRFSIREHPDSIYSDPSESWEDAVITGVEDTGPGGDVIVRFVSGAVLVIEGYGTGAVTDISGIVDYPLI
ncbi:hypothetical protein LAZ40_12700 [Cereibacter sphaeroides]|uniref:hypothetical protein n=1 Tax=Cereibacter sphaeroides TaxID=1063 RepID=UPI001F19841D|nr:hypothetical protein [Cereibacter sphaeroides]MCE6959882.1 hypothetical protein [Cereibacter sphaeroides]MCE6968651.1 hypothetical protein [Cereibacter sphaeroides]MCE6974736.1 hypothetical protein [Cereibacter sphaeroides]